MNRTLDYYNTHSSSYVNNTQSVDFSSIQDAFIAHIDFNALILDFGCGSGRDTRYFIEHGFLVEAIDGSEAMCEIASKYTGIQVKKMLFQELNENARYDGIWACASILHLPLDELVNVLKKMARALKKNGVIYTSFKYGDKDSYQGDRYYTNMTENRIKDLMMKMPELRILKEWISMDVRPDKSEEKWLNLFLVKK